MEMQRNEDCSEEQRSSGEVRRHRHDASVAGQANDDGTASEFALRKIAGRRLEVVQGGVERSQFGGAVSAGLQMSGLRSACGRRVEDEVADLFVREVLGWVGQHT